MRLIFIFLLFTAAATVATIIFALRMTAQLQSLNETALTNLQNLASSTLGLVAAIASGIFAISISILAFKIQQRSFRLDSARLSLDAFALVQKELGDFFRMSASIQIRIEQIFYISFALQHEFENNGRKMFEDGATPEDIASSDMTRNERAYLAAIADQTRHLLGEITKSVSSASVHSTTTMRRMTRYQGKLGTYDIYTIGSLVSRNLIMLETARSREVLSSAKTFCFRKSKVAPQCQDEWLNSLNFLLFLVSNNMEIAEIVGDVLAKAILGKNSIAAPMVVENILSDVSGETTSEASKALEKEVSQMMHALWSDDEMVSYLVRALKCRAGE